MKSLTNIDLNGNEIQNAQVQNLGTDPAGLGTSHKGRVWFNSSSNLFKVWDGTAAKIVTNEPSDTANTASTLVMRDGSGNFSAGTITANLTGTATNAAALGGQSLAQVRDFSLTTGQRTATSAISDFDTQVRTSRLDQMATPTLPVAFGGQNLTGVAAPSAGTDAANKTYVDGRRLDQAAAPTADVSLNSFKITNLATPTVSGDAVTKGYVDGRTLNNFGAPTASLSMGSQVVTNVGTPSAATDAATKGYVDGRRLDQAAAPTAAVSLNSQQIINLATPSLTTDAATKGYVDGRTLSQAAAPTADVSLAGFKLTNVGTPTAAGDAATKGYVDSVAAGLDAKESVRAATTANLAATYANGTGGVGATLTASANGVMGAVDGVTPAAGNRLLVKNQTTAAQNGVYTVTDVGAAGAPWVLTRATDFDTATEVTSGAHFFVEEGSTLGASGWVLSTTGSITMGTTGLTFAQFSGLGAGGGYSEGNGIDISGTVISAVGTTNRIDVSSGSIDISSAYVGQTSITTLGTIATGTWNGTTIAVANGGTGGTTQATARAGIAATGKNSSDVAAGTSFAFTHNLGTTDVVVQVREISTGNVVFCDVTVTNSNTVTLTFGSSVAGATYRVTVIG